MTGQAANVDLITLERSVFRRTFSHGLIDIAVSCFVVTFAVGPYTTGIGLGDFWGSVVFIPFWGLAALVLWFIHRHTVVPRLGHVAFARPRKRRLFAWHIVALVICAVALGLGAVSAARFGLLPPMFHLGAFSIAVLTLSALAAYYLELRRFYVYAVVIASAPFTGEFLWKYAGVPHHGYPVTFGFAAALCLLVGVGLLVRFTLRHPLRPGEAGPLGE